MTIHNIIITNKFVLSTWWCFIFYVNYTTDPSYYVFKNKLSGYCKYKNLEDL